MQIKNQNTTSSVETLTTGLDLARHQLHHHLVALLDRRVAEGDPCSRTRYHLKNYSIGSLAVEVEVVSPHSVGFQLQILAFLVSLAYEQTGGGMFDTGPQFVFNLGGGPGFRVHQFGGGRPRRRPRETNGTDEESQRSGLSALSNLLPLLILFILPLLSSLFSSGSTAAGPKFHFDSPEPPYTLHRTSAKLKVDYFVNPKDVVDLTPRKMNDLDNRADATYVQKLKYECELEVQGRDRMMQEAQGWFFQDVDRMREARNLDLRSCRRLSELGQHRNSY